jgi:UDP-glucose 4-epimerase
LRSTSFTKLFAQQIAIKEVNTMSHVKPMILVTGGAGYIGSHTVQSLQKAGYGVIILDNLVYGHRELVDNVLKAKLIVGDISDRALLSDIFSTYPISAVIHFAAYAYVGESVMFPAKYYRNNVVGTLTLLEAMIAASVKKIVFSSTCATYGVPMSLPITEDHPQRPINPYGISKLTVEKMLADFDGAYGLKSVIFRYFNAAGADPVGRLGEDHSPETHLLPLVLMAALGKREAVSILGNDYPTPDGTCIRDYIHVADLAQAHIQGLDYLLSGNDSDVFNLGNGGGFSVKEVIEAAREITGKTIEAIACPRRPGDPPILIGSSEKANKVLGWQPQYPNLKDMLLHAWNWHLKRHGLKSDLLRQLESYRFEPTNLSYLISSQSSQVVSH